MTIYELCLLHSRADRALRNIVAEKLEPFEITMMQWLLLGVVKAAPKQGINMSDIATGLGITLPQVTALLSDLTKRRLTKLKTQRKDRRSRHASLTSRGEEILDKAAIEIESKLDTVFPSEKRLQYVSMLESMIPGESESMILEVKKEETK